MDFIFRMISNYSNREYLKYTSIIQKITKDEGEYFKPYQSTKPSNANKFGGFHVINVKYLHKSSSEMQLRVKYSYYIEKPGQ